MWLLPIFNLDKVLDLYNATKESNMNYYENEHGNDVRDWYMENKPFDWIKVSFFNALKYNVRAGKKPGEPSLKDLDKLDSYMDDYILLTGLDSEVAYDKLLKATAEFLEYDN